MHNKDKIIPCVIGLGYVGLPIFLKLQKKFQTIGYDKKKRRVKDLSIRIDQNYEYKKKQLILKNRSFYTEKNDSFKRSNFFIICVPTPIFSNKKPDLSFIKSACMSLSKYLKKDDIVVLESTVYPGVTEDFCGQLLAKYSKLKVNKDFHLAYSPERINPGDKKHTVDKVIKIVSYSGNNNTVKKKILRVYKSVTKKIVFSKKIKESETAKLIENIQRDLNIALINEIFVACDKIGLDFNEVLKLADTKWNFMKFTPGLVGGHCLPIDPYYFSHIAKIKNYNPKIILSGRSVNEKMDDFIIKKINQKIFENHIKNPSILLMGATYKPNVADFRNSLSIKIYKKLNIKYGKVFIYDPYLKSGYFKGVKILKSYTKISKFDLIVKLVKHKEVETKLKKIKFNKQKLLNFF